MKRMIVATALLIAAQFVLLTGTDARAQLPDDDSSMTDQLWIDVGIGPEFVDWINRTARDDDIVRIDHLPMISLLENVQRGQRLVVVKTIDEAEQLLPQAAYQIDIIGYNLEHGPANDPGEKARPVESVQRMRELADDYGLQLAVGPDHSFALSDGVAMAEYADIMILQIQKVQEDPATVMDFVVPLAESMRVRNPEIEVSVQIGAQGDVEELTTLVRQLAPALDGVSILTDHAGADFSEQFVMALRTELSPASETIATAVPSDGAPIQATVTVAPLSTSSATSPPQPTATLVESNDDELVAHSASIVYRPGFIFLTVFGIGLTVTALLYLRPQSR